ncbi:MAG: hypothetical protein KAY24_13990 [Candidatus Eisenbacteria sp.]|nr:hypothetical protein [Candidatus Eisenbacteria bacterium]
MVPPPRLIQLSRNASIAKITKILNHIACLETAACHDNLDNTVFDKTGSVHIPCFTNMDSNSNGLLFANVLGTDQ